MTDEGGCIVHTSGAGREAGVPALSQARRRRLTEGESRHGRHCDGVEGEQASPRSCDFSSLFFISRLHDRPFVLRLAREEGHRVTGAGADVGRAPKRRKRDRERSWASDVSEGGVGSALSGVDDGQIVDGLGNVRVEDSRDAQDGQFQSTRKHPNLPFSTGSLIN